MITPEGTKQHEPAAPLAPAGKFDMEVLVGYILLVGVLLSVLLILIGFGWNWIATGQLNLQVAVSKMNFLRFTADAFSRLFHGELAPPLIINLGIVTLLFTPYLRVFASMVYFAIRRNWKYTLFTGFVLAVLSYSLFLR